MIQNQILSGTKIEGTVHLSRPTTLSCQIDGSLVSESEVVVDDLGLVTGTVDAPFVQVDGKVSGAMRAKKELRVGGDATLQGDISTTKLTIQDGAKINATLSVGKYAINSSA